MTKQELVNLLFEAIKKIEGWSPKSRSFRNNNPGNLWDGLTLTKKKRIWPVLPIDKQGFLIYPTYELGKRALEKDIHIKIDAGKSLESFFYMYAPPNENNTEQYIKSVILLTKISDRKRKLLDYLNA